MINVFIGYDRAEPIAFSVLAHSIHIRASEPVAITPLMLSQLDDVFNRERNPLQSTDFSFTRFLTPYLCNFEGWSIFMDCDMIVLDDIKKLWDCRDPSFAVQVVKHCHEPKEEKKFLDQIQTRYEKKNWSSVMLFNNALCKKLTPDYVNKATGLELHQFKWLDSESLIGEIPHRWNHLVDYDKPQDDIALLHYTQGGPYFKAYANCGFADEWNKEKEMMDTVCQNKLDKKDFNVK